MLFEKPKLLTKKKEKPMQDTNELSIDINKATLRDNNGVYEKKKRKQAKTSKRKNRRRSLNGQ